VASLLLANGLEVAAAIELQSTRYLGMMQPNPPHASSRPIPELSCRSMPWHRLVIGSDHLSFSALADPPTEKHRRRHGLHLSFDPSWDYRRNFPPEKGRKIGSACSLPAEQFYITRLSSLLFQFFSLSNTHSTPSVPYRQPRKIFPTQPWPSKPISLHDAFLESNSSHVRGSGHCHGPQQQ